jgi:hypothetical protein
MQAMTNIFSLPAFYCLQNISLHLDFLKHFFIFYVIVPTDLHPSPAPYFRNNSGVCDILSEVFKFQHRKKLHSKHSALYQFLPEI